MTIEWKHELIEQLDWHWQHQIRPRFDGLTDEEYFWEPVPECWNVRRRTAATPASAPGSGEFTVEFAHPAPTPTPVTTIAWRLSHLQVGVLGARVGNHFGGQPVDYLSYNYPGTAAEALTNLDGVYQQWIDGVRAADETALARPIGPAEGPWAEHSLAALVFHINREMIHHSAEIALLRDLFAHWPRQ